MNLTRFGPFRELEALSARLDAWLGKPFARALAEGSMSLADRTPALDVHETDGEDVIKAEVKVS